MSCQIDDFEIYHLKICIFQSSTKSQSNYEVFFRFTSDKYIDFYTVNLERYIKGCQEIN